MTTQSPDTGLTQVSYDSAGNVSSQIDANGRLAASSYDALNRVTQTRYAGTTATTFSYDQRSHGIGHLTSMEDASGSTDWTYDGLGHTVSKTQSVNGLTSAVQYGYDSAGRLTTITYPSGAVVQYGYTLDLVTQISVNGAILMSGITYQPFHGPPNAWKWGNGTAYSRHFDQDQRLAQYPLGSRSRTLTFDAASRITGFTDSNLAYSQTFGYDAADRLTQYAASTGGERYTYDALGNRTTLTSTVPGASNVSYGYSGSSNQLVSETSASTVTPIEYDPTGNTVSDGTNQFTYDGRNRLIEASNAQGVSYYSINGLGQRIAKLGGAPLNLAGDANQDGVLNATDLRLIALMANGSIPVNLAADCNGDGQVTTADVSCVSTKIANMRLNPQSYVAAAGTEFVYDESGHLIGEYGAAGAPVEETIYLGDMPIAVVKSGSVSYIYPDHHNAPRTVMNTANTVLWDWEGAPFGNSPANQNPSGLGTFAYNLRFPGRYYDAETGLHYNNARDYRPSTGRYIESDPLGLAGGINSYEYVDADAVSTSDMTGTVNEKLFNCFQNPLLCAYANSYNPTGVFKIAGHGLSDSSGDITSIGSDVESYSPGSLARLLIDDKQLGYVPGTPIELVACNAGARSTSGLRNSFALDLSYYLQLFSKTPTQVTGYLGPLIVDPAPGATRGNPLIGHVSIPPMQQYTY